MNEDKAARYHRLRRRATLLAAAWSVLWLAGLLLTGLSHGIRDLAAALTSSLNPPALLHLPVTAAAWVVVVAGVNEAGSLPFVFYGSFVLERRYGLSRQTVVEWWRDHAKAVGVGLAMALAAAVFVTAALARWPLRWWVATWAAGVAVSVGLIFAAPVILLPLFFRFAPLQHEGLRRRLLALAERLGAPAIGIFEWRLSDRTSRANAALAGIGRTRRILVSDTLVADYQEDEVEVILAHELAHHVRHDVWRTLVFDAALAGLALWIADAALRWSLVPLRLRGLSDVAGLPVLVLAVLGVSFALLPVANAVSRAHERRADLIALETTGNAEAFVRAMRRLGAGNLAEEAPSLVVRLFFHTHPPLGERLAFAEAWARMRRERDEVGPTGVAR